MTKIGKLQEHFHELVEKTGDKSSYSINVSNFAKVISYDSIHHIADIQPQINDEGGQDDIGIIVGCPVLMNCYAFDGGRSMRDGATVFVVFNDRDLDNFEGNSYTKASDRTHSINDAVVVGVYEG